MKKLDTKFYRLMLKGLAAVSLLTMAFVNQSLGQCTNSTSYGSANAPTGPAPVTITTCAFPGEYSTVNNATAGVDYEINATGGSGNYLTIRQGTPTGVVLAFGFAPVQVTPTANGSFYNHLNTNENCGTESMCHVVTITCTSCTQPTCPSGLGSYVEITLPYYATGLTNCGSGNDLTSANVSQICGSTSYYSGEDEVFIFTPSTSGQITIEITSSTSYIGLMLYEGCPLYGEGGACAGYAQSSASSKSFQATVTAGQTYYLIVDTWAAPTCIPDFTLSISEPTPPPSCPEGLGSYTNITLPYYATGLTNCGSGNDLTSANVSPICGATYYYNGEDEVFIFTPSGSGEITIAITSSTSYIGLMLYEGCPLLGQGGTCVGYVQSSASSKSFQATVTAGQTYYLIVDTWAAPTCIPDFTLDITAPPVPLSTWYQDSDGDGYGNPNISQDAATQPAGYVADNTDCDDNNADVNPGATEVCNGIDDNCDGQIDEGVTLTFYADNDGDGYGDAASSIVACSAPAGYVADNTDCDDNNADVNPGATEVCNGIDDNCDGQIDEGVTTTYYADIDGDGYGDAASSVVACSAPAGYVTNNTDCDDNNADVNPGATEVCNGIDDNCDGQIDEGVTTTYYADIDGDGYGDPNSAIEACSLPAGYVTNDLDCNDDDADINPEATEVCGNFVDDNCDGQIDEGCCTLEASLPDCKSVYDSYGPSSVTLTPDVTGAQGQTTYLWSNGATTSSITVSPTSNTVYTVTITDELGCVVTASTLVERVNYRCTTIGVVKLWVCYNGNSLCVQLRLVPAYLALGATLGQCNAATPCEPYEPFAGGGSNNLMVLDNADWNDVLAEPQQLEVYPNPASDKVNLVFSQPFEAAVVKLLDLQGRTVAMQKLEANTVALELPLNGLAAGTYFLNAVVDNEVFTKKLVIE